MNDSLNQIDFGLNDIDCGIGKKATPRPVDPKDPFGMNSLADGMKSDMQKTITDISKDVKQFKDEVAPIYNQIKQFFDYIKVRKQVKNIIIFGQNIRNKRNEPR